MNVNFRILGLDPGGTTGWSCYDAELDLSRKPDIKGGMAIPKDWKLTVGHIADDKHDHHEELYSLLEDRAIQNFYIVCESFEFRNYGKHRDNINLMSREYIGVTKLFAQHREMTKRLIFLTAGQSKKFIPDKPENGMAANAKLKALGPGWYNPGYKHANDATRLVVNVLVNKFKRYDLVEPWRNLV